MKKTVMFYILSALFICATLLFFKFIVGNEKTANDNPIDGFSKRKAGDYLGAKADFDKAIEQDPTNFKLYYERGLCNQDLSEYNYAIEDYKKAIELNNYYADAYYNMGWCKFQIGDKKGACSDWQKSVDNNGEGQKELETCCNPDKKQEEIVREEEDNLEVKKETPSPQTKKLYDMTHRKLKFHGGKLSFSYVYLNDAPYGRIVDIYYDDFYKTYSVSFFNSSGEKITFELKDSNFTETWEFVYNGGKYELTNYKKGRLYY